MAIEKVINIRINEQGFDNVEDQANELSDSLERVARASDDLESNYNGASAGADNFGKSTGSLTGKVLENGGAMGLLNDLTGGLAMTFKDGVEALEVFGVGLFQNTVATEAETVATTQSTIATKAKTVAQALYTTVVGGTTGALKALRIALAATGIGAVVVLIGLLITYLASAKKETNGLEAEQEQLNKTLERYNQLIKENLSLIKNETEVAVLRARIAGKSQADIEKIMSDGRKKEIQALQDDYAAKEKLYQDFAKQATAALSQLDATDEDDAEKRDKILESEKKYYTESRAAADAYFEARRQNVNADLELQAEASEKLRDEQKAVAEKAREDEKKRREDEIAKEKERRQKILEDLIEFNKMIRALNDERAESDINAEIAKDVLLRELRGRSAVQQIEDERATNLAILEAGKATFEELLQFNIEYDERVRAAREQMELDRINASDLAIENERIAFETRLEMLAMQDQMILESTVLTEAQKTQALYENSEARKAINQAEFEASQLLAERSASTLEKMSALAGKGTAAGKVLATASALISTYQGIAAELATKTTTPFEIGLKVANVAYIAKTGFDAVKNILKTPVPGGGGSGGGSGSAPQASAPQFNIVGQNSNNQLATAVNNQNQQPVQAYVVANQVTTQQGLDRAIVQTATFN